MLEGALLQTGEAATGVGLPAPLGVLAVVDDVDTVLGLLLHNPGDGVSNLFGEGVIEGVAVAAGGHYVAEVVGPVEGAGVAGDDPVSAAVHLSSDAKR